MVFNSSNIKKYLGLFLLVVFLVSSYTVGIKQAIADPFVCDGSFYLSYSTNPSPTILYLVDRTTNPFTFVPIGDDSHGLIYNAIDYNPLDGYFYAISVSGDLLKIDNAGVVTNLGATGLGYAPNAGAITADGKYVLARTVSGTGDVSIIDLALVTPAIVDTFNIGLIVSYDGDFAYNSLNGKIYGVASILGERSLFYFDIDSGPDQGVVNVVGPIGSATSFGGMFSDSLGNIYAAENSGGFYNIDTTTGLAVLISGAPSSFSMDGGSCSQAVSSFSSDISLTNTTLAIDFAPGDVITYTITVANNGPIGATGIEVSDILPLDVTGSWTCSASGGAVCAASGTGDLSDTVSLPNGSSIVYSFLVTTSPTYSASTLSNTASISLPLSVNDPDTSNNTVDPIVLSNTSYVPPVETSTTTTAYLPPDDNTENEVITTETVTSVSSLEEILKDKKCMYFSQHMKKGDIDGENGKAKQESGVSSLIKEIAFLQGVLNILGYDSGPVDGIYGAKTAGAVSEFQQKYFDLVLKPWGLLKPTGFFYKSSEVRLNEVLGCDDSVILDNGVFVD